MESHDLRGLVAVDFLPDGVKPILSRHRAVTSTLLQTEPAGDLPDVALNHPLFHAVDLVLSIQPVPSHRHFLLIDTMLILPLLAVQAVVECLNLLVSVTEIPLSDI